MKKIEHIIVSNNAFNSEDPYDIIQSNISFLNVLLEEGAQEEWLNDDAFLSYYVDYYDSQYGNGNFSQFVWNSGYNASLNALVEKGLEKIGAVKHLAHFRKMLEEANKFSKEEMEEFLGGEYFGTNPLRDRLKNDEFYDIDEEIMELNSKWLRNHPSLKVLTIDEMFEFAEEFLGKKIER